ncbi:MAG: hypothetical protein WCS52_05995 [bacterium]|jgi:hypothetical protein
MKKIVMCLTISGILFSSVSPSMAINEQRGGLMGFIAGCCFGIRAGAAYNDGKDIHWREWILLIPIVGFVASIWNGIDGANGMQKADYAKQYGSTFY